MKNGIPKLYETEEVPLDGKTIYQVYTIPSVKFYWLISELDEKKNLAFGFANLNNDIFAEWGYISINELLENGAELVEDWEPCKYPEARKLIEERLNNGGRF